ncbi:MAG TPA: hypothetical protein VH643_12565 [Gemmataceae bacterium]|jgi:hypothetical protein
MSNVVIQVNGSSTGSGFLIAPDGARTFSVQLKLTWAFALVYSATGAWPRTAFRSLSCCWRARPAVSADGGNPNRLLEAFLTEPLGAAGW